MSRLISRKFIVYRFTLQDPGRCNSLDLDHSLLIALIKMLSRIMLCHRTITLDTSTSHIYSFKYPSNHIKNEVDKITFNILFNPTHPNNIISSCDKYEKHYWGILHFSLAVFKSGVYFMQHLTTGTNHISSSQEPTQLRGLDCVALDRRAGGGPCGQLPGWCRM